MTTASFAVNTAALDVTGEPQGPLTTTVYDPPEVGYKSTNCRILYLHKIFFTSPQPPPNTAHPNSLPEI